MRNDRLHAILLGAAIACILLVSPTGSFAADPTQADICNGIQSMTGKASFQANLVDVKKCMQLGWPVPSGWVPDGGKGPGITAGGSGGFSYGTVKAPESPPGSRGENASITAAAIKSSCNFPPRISSSGHIDMPTGSCLNYYLHKFKDMYSDATPPPPPVGVTIDDTCPADSNNAGLYGVKKTAASTIPLACGGAAPFTTADLVLNVNPTNVVTATNGTYTIWLYRKSGAGFSDVSGPTGIALPPYLFGPADEWGSCNVSVNLTPPIEQVITYKAGDPYIAIHLQPRATMPSTYIPPYAIGDPERYLLLPLDGAGNPSIPSGCGDDGAWSTTHGNESIYIKSMTNPGVSCPGNPKTQSVYELCPDGSTAVTGVGCPADSDGNRPPPVATPVWLCNAANPMPAYANIIPPVPPDATGVCPNDSSASMTSNSVPTSSSYSSTCTPTSASTDQSCEVVSMPIPVTDACPNMQQFSALNRPSVYFPPGTTATFHDIADRTQKMVDTLANTRLYMQSNTLVTVQSNAPPITFTEGGSITQHDNSILIMRAPATFTPGSGQAVMTNGGQLVSSGGKQLAIYGVNGAYTIPGGAPYTIQVGRSMSLPGGFMIPTVPATSSQPAYIQLPVPMVH